MAQFDVYDLGDLLVVDLQSDLINLDLTRIVAPLRQEGRHEFLPRVTPNVVFHGQPYVAHVHDLATLSARQLADPIVSLSEYRDELLRAVDILTRGF